MAVPEFTSTVVVTSTEPVSVETPPQRVAVPTASPASGSSSLENSRSIAWFGDNTKLTQAPTLTSEATGPSGASSEVSAPRMVFGTNASVSLTKPTAFKIPSSFDTSRLNKTVSQVTSPARTEAQSDVTKPNPSLSLSLGKPFSMSLKTKAADNRGSSAVGSSVSGLSQNSSGTAPKRKGLEIFGAAGKKIKL
eukprot:Blabericola_migrator_1__7642@NODE_38_length_17790_cov_195_231733_g34_i0_p8_GENE_NODE_38_length_17790_cov_195_231733_g34_i0NODE_38_length_17790_cov_195_231733_g34_i0_p8_ORF_typecomplete_len193_score55_82_NODE_38_length_17790_cov_195_231733_g34_i088949472